MSEERLPPSGGDELIDDEFDLDEPQDTETDGEPDPAGDADAEPGGDEASGVPATETRPAQQRPGRRERQQQELRTLRENHARLERELTQLRQQQQQPRPDPAEQMRAAERERQYLDTLAPEQRVDYLFQRQQQQFNAQLAQQRLETADQIDRATFAGTCAANPLRARYQDEVEALCRSERDAGRPTNREAVFRYILGRHAEEQYQRRGAETRRTGQRNIARQTTRPAAGRSDTGNGTARPRADDDSIEATRARLRNQPLWES